MTPLIVPARICSKMRHCSCSILQSAAIEAVCMVVEQMTAAAPPIVKRGEQQRAGFHSSSNLHCHRCCFCCCFCYCCHHCRSFLFLHLMLLCATLIGRSQRSARSIDQSTRRRRRPPHAAHRSRRAIPSSFEPSADPGSVILRTNMFHGCVELFSLSI